MPWGAACVLPSLDGRGMEMEAATKTLSSGKKFPAFPRLSFPFLPFHRFGETTVGSTRPQLPPTTEATGIRSGNLQ